jgi:hypothetical protein
MTYPYPGQPAPAGPPGYPPQQQPAQQYAPAPPPAPQGFGQPPAGPPQFSAPGSMGGGDMLKPDEVNGHLLIVVPHEYLSNIMTSQGPSDAIRVNVVDLDAAGADGQPGRTYRDVLWFPKVLRGSLRKQLEEQGRVFVLATMGRGTQRGSNSPPWVLQDQTGNPQAVERAQAFLARRPGWQAEPGDFAEQRAQQAAHAAPHVWPQGAAPAAQPYAQPAPPPYPGYPGPGAPSPAPYPPQPAQPYPPQPAGPYPPQYPAAPAAQVTDPSVAALYGQMGHPQGVPQQQ